MLLLSRVISREEPPPSRATQVAGIVTAISQTTPSDLLRANSTARFSSVRSAPLSGLHVRCFSEMPSSNEPREQSARSSCVPLSSASSFSVSHSISVSLTAIFLSPLLYLYFPSLLSALPFSGRQQQAIWLALFSSIFFLSSSLFFLHTKPENGCFYRHCCGQ